jgi:hypothetical protein
VRDPKDVIQTTVPASLQFLKVNLTNPTTTNRRLDNGKCTIECQVKSSRTVANIIIKANFYDKTGAFLSDDTAFRASLSAGEVWKFSLGSDNSDAQVGKIVTVQVAE